MIKYTAFQLLVGASCALAFGNAPSLNSIRFDQIASKKSSHKVGKSHMSSTCNDISMFQEGTNTNVPTITRKLNDKTKVGTLLVPSIGIGTISWSSKRLTAFENFELQSLVNEAKDLDGAFFDTAERYGSHMKTAFGLGWGETETFLQKFVNSGSQVSTKDDIKYKTRNSKMQSSDSIIATKFTPSPWRTSVESVVEACEQSRRRLGVEQIDLYQLHMPDIVKPFRFLGISDSLDEVYWEGLAECYNRGLVKNVGVCNYGPTLVSKCHDFLRSRGVPLASNQIAYSLIGRRNGAQETVDTCSKLGVKVLAYYPFAMGLLTGKYSNNLSATTESTITSLTKSKKTKLELNDLQAYATGDGEKVPDGGISALLSVMDEIATRRNKTVAQVALNYIVCKGVIPIPGANSVAQVKDNIGAMGWRLTKREVARLEEESDKLGFAFEGAGFKRTSEKFVGYGVEKWALD